MQRTHAVTAGLVAVAASIGAVSLATSGSAQTPGPTTIALKEKQGFGKFIDQPPKARGRNGAPSSGDAFSFDGPVVDKATKAAAGRFSGLCTILKGGRKPVVQCAVTFTLKDGTITAAGLSQDDRDFDAPVTGGTGSYDGARGTIHVHHAKDGDEDTIALLP
jgi:hypothetical protein